MGNPTATITFVVADPADPEIIRDAFTRVSFGEIKFFTYGEDEWTAAQTAFDPNGKGERFFMLIRLEDAFYNSLYGDAVKPEFIAQEIFDRNFRQAGSGFAIPSIHSVLPKVMVPSMLLVDNGSKNIDSFNAKTVNNQNLYNWSLVEVNGDTTFADPYKIIQVGGFFGSQYITVKNKDDTAYDNTVKLKLEEPVAPKATGFWTSGVDNTQVVTGAFAMLINVESIRAGQGDPAAQSQRPWSIVLEFGEVEISITEAGAIQVTVGVAGEKNVTKANLGEAQTKEGPPQRSQFSDATPFVIAVYPVWNGIVISTGVQDTSSMVDTAATFCPKLKNASILSSTYSTTFDPNSPAETLVGTGAGATNVLVDFGTSMDVTARNCRFEMAWLPAFFSHRLWFDEWFLASEDTATATFEFDVYPIWTKNGTDSSFSPAPVITNTDKTAPAGLDWKLIEWRLEQDAPNRFAPQIFGAFLRIRETNTFPVNNSNGSFALTWNAFGAKGDPDPFADAQWWKYAKSLSVSIGLDGSSGSITIDKYGIAGQDAEAIQAVGAIAITMDASGADGTTAGAIFKGLAMGISDSQSPEGSTWTIPLVGLEKKMEDIALINVPFFDGRTGAVTLDFLTRYAGLVSDLTFAPAASAETITISEDPSKPFLDFNTGTTVKEAVDQVMSNLLSTYVVRDGKIFFYDRDLTTGLPVFLGTDHSATYPSTKITMIDQSIDFQNLRNRIVTFGMEQQKEGKGADLNTNLFPRLVTIANTTSPSFPWDRAMAHGVRGFVDEAKLTTIAGRLASVTKKFTTIGRTTVAGNATIKPYDTIGAFVITGVTHNVDFEAKSWTTDLEFASQ